MRADGTGGIGLMIARLPDGGSGIAVGARGGVDIGDHLRPCAVDTLPAGMNVAQEGQILGRMERGDGAKPGIAWCCDLTARSPRPVTQPRDPLGLFRAGLNDTVGHEILRFMLPLAVVENGFHRPSPFSPSNPAGGRRI